MGICDKLSHDKNTLATSPQYCIYSDILKKKDKLILEPIEKCRTIELRTSQYVQ